MELSGTRQKKSKVKEIIFREMELTSPKNKKIQEQTFRTRKIKKAHPEKISYISGNGTFYPQA